MTTGTAPVSSYTCQLGRSGDIIPIACSLRHMARLARIVVPGRARHVTQRGNRREPSFFEEGDQAIYLALMAEQTAKHEAQLWTYG